MVTRALDSRLVSSNRSDTAFVQALLFRIVVRDHSWDKGELWVKSVYPLWSSTMDGRGRRRRQVHKRRTGHPKAPVGVSAEAPARVAVGRTDL
jgi:hypothetical protein